MEREQVENAGATIAASTVRANQLRHLIDGSRRWDPSEDEGYPSAELGAELLRVIRRQVTPEMRANRERSWAARSTGCRESEAKDVAKQHLNAIVNDAVFA